MSRERTILVVAIITALAAAVLLLVSPALIWLRVLIGAPFVLLLPGNAVLLYVDADERLGSSEWFVLAVGVSISVTMLAGLGLASSIGLSATWMIIALSAATLLALIAASLRPGADAPRRAIPTRRRPVRRLAFGVMSLLACVAAVYLLSVPWGAAQSSSRTVQLWGLPVQSDGSLSIGARNIDASSRHYRLTIKQAGQLISRQEFDMPSGTSHIFVVKKTAIPSNSDPVTGVLTDTSGVVTPRNISVWVTR